MVIEKLTFEVRPEDRDRWLEVEERTWSRFLEKQDGFVRKEIWVEEDDDAHVHAVIWWESKDQWKAIPSSAVDAVDESMGEWLRKPTMREFHVIRER